MIKTHTKTKLKYLCKKSTNNVKKCYTYLGSGVYWKRHILKYGKEISTEIIEVCDSIEQLREKGLYWSDYYNIVESEEWANLVVENGSNINDRSFKKMTECQKLLCKKRLKDKKFRQKLIQNGKKTSIRQRGKKMIERMGSEWVDPRKGKTMKEIYKPGHMHPQIKPYKIILNDGEKEWSFNCESEIKDIGLYPYPTLGNLKKLGTIYIKHTRVNSRHGFKKGDKLSFEYIIK